LNIFFLIALTKITAVIWWIKNLVRKLEIFNLPFEFFKIFVWLYDYNKYWNCISGVMISVLASSAIDRGFEPRSGQAKYFKIGIWCFSANHTTLRRKSQDWLAWNQDNVSECGDMSIHRLLFQWASTIKSQLSVLV
jgi:hypothetical protein